MTAIFGHELTPTDYVLGVIIALVGLFVLYHLYLYFFGGPLSVTTVKVTSWPTSTSANAITFTCTVPSSVTSVAKWTSGKFSLTIGSTTITGSITSASLSTTTATVSGTVDASVVATAITTSSGYAASPSDVGTITMAS